MSERRTKARTANTTNTHTHTFQRSYYNIIFNGLCRVRKMPPQIKQLLIQTNNYQVRNFHCDASQDISENYTPNYEENEFRKITKSTIHRFHTDEKSHVNTQ